LRLTYEEFVASLDDRDNRRRLLWRGERPFFVLMSQQFQRADLDRLFTTATAIRRLDRHVDGRIFLRGLLYGLRVMCLFAQPSTRTAESFVAASEKLGATARVVSDLRTSSFVKGESVEDAVRVLSSFYDTLVTRHPEDTFAERASWALYRSNRPIPVISGGSGKSQHPTQALLDVYTLAYSMNARGGLDGKRVLLVGDIGRNRAARSLAYLLTRYDVKRIDVACMPAHRPEPEFAAYFQRHGVELVLHDTLDAAIQAEGAHLDAVYVTRLQQEWDGEGASPGSHPDFVLHPGYRDALRHDCAILHPLPRVNELPDAWEDHPGFVVWRQVRNGMWMRAALLAAVHGADEEIVARAHRHGLV
jgi:aspartate carbamoyltransferase catalytic subunit